MFDGPQSDKCIKSQWKKSGYTGDVYDRIDNDDKTKLKAKNVSYTDVLTYMKSIRNVANTSSNYETAKKEYKKCYKTNLDPCENRFNPRPKECAQKLYDESGCLEKGKLNPKNITSENGYATSSWLNIQNIGPKGQYTDKLKSIRSKTSPGLLINPTFDKFDDIVDAHMKCNGVFPKMPFDKPCWKDFIYIKNYASVLKK